MSTRFSHNPYYQEYERLLIQLAASMANNDEQEADRIREEMDRPERELNAEEIQRLNGLSADLYMLYDAEIFEPCVQNQGELTRALASAWQQGDHTRVLALLRKGPTLFQKDRIAYMRARAYEGLGHDDPSLLFMRYADALSQGVDDFSKEYKWFILEQLARQKRFDEARQEAQRNIENDASSPSLLIHSAAVMYFATQEMSREQAKPIFRQVTRILNDALRSIDDVQPSVVSYGLVTLGSCYEALDDATAALSAYNKAIEWEPGNNETLVLRGLLRLDGDPEGALSDFDQAIENRTTIPTPYLILASNAYSRGDYDRCLRLANAVLSLTEDPSICSSALQLIGLVKVEAKEPKDTVKKTFEKALWLNPFDETTRLILENLSSENGTANSNEFVFRPSVINMQGLTGKYPDIPTLAYTQ